VCSKKGVGWVDLGEFYCKFDVVLFNLSEIILSVDFIGL
jgi:hypothetical protein